MLSWPSLQVWRWKIWKWLDSFLHRFPESVRQSASQTDYWETPKSRFRWKIARNNSQLSSRPSSICQHQRNFFRIETNHQWCSARLNHWPTSIPYLLQRPTGCFHWQSFLRICRRLQVSFHWRHFFQKRLAETWILVWRKSHEPKSWQLRESQLQRQPNFLLLWTRNEKRS